MMVSSRSSVIHRATMMMVVLLTLSTTKVVRGENQCQDDHDCPLRQYCYNVSHFCVNFTQCVRHNRMEAELPARQPSQCGPCLEGYGAEILATGEPAVLCKRREILEQTANEPEKMDGVNAIYIGCGVLFVIIVIFLIGWKIKKLIAFTASKGCVSERFFEKVGFLASPTAPPQDDASSYLRSPAYPNEERPPVYTPAVTTTVDREQLVNASPCKPPAWVAKPPYEPDFNDNIADGVAIPIHSSSTNLQMELEEEGETNPSSWTPGQVTIESRPFGLFSNSEQQDNELNNGLMRVNCSSDSREESTSDNNSETPDEPSGSRMHGGIYCGPNVQINQTITLNIAKNGTK